jgi:hypothetical protein
MSSCQSTEIEKAYLYDATKVEVMSGDKYCDKTSQADLRLPSEDFPLANNKEQLKSEDEPCLSSSVMALFSSPRPSFARLRVSDGNALKTVGSDRASTLERRSSRSLGGEKRYTHRSGAASSRNPHYGGQKTATTANEDSDLYNHIYGVMQL